MRGRSQNAARQVVKARFIPSNCPLCGNHLGRDIWSNDRNASWSERQSPPAHPIFLDHNDALNNVLFGEASQHIRHPRDYFGFTPVSVAEKDQARLNWSAECQQPRIVEISRNDCAQLLFSAGQDFSIGGAVQAEVRCMFGVMTSGSKPPSRAREACPREISCGGRCRLQRDCFILGKEGRIPQSLIDIAGLKIGIGP